jgi:peptidoglycan/xylan/chitin deacetylase (PgdA/CDA1 family)
MLQLPLGLISLLNRLRLGESPLAILYYHRVMQQADPFRPDDPTIDAFEQQIAYLSRHFNILTMDDAIARLKSRTLPARSLVLTFDDGYRDNLTQAAPILAKYKAPATVFVATNGLETGILWNDKLTHAIEHSSAAEISLPEISVQLSLADQENRQLANSQLINQLKFLPQSERDRWVSEVLEQLAVEDYPRLMLNPSELVDLRNHGWQIGAHTHDHSILSCESDEDSAFQIRHSCQRLAEVLDEPVRYFAYPNGLFGRDFGQRECNVVKNLSLEAAFSTNDGGATSRTSSWAIPRFMPFRKQLPLFALSIAKIMGEHE